MAGNDDLETRIPRREAVPLRWAKLAQEQADALPEAQADALTKAQQGAALQLWALFANYYLDKAPIRSRYDSKRNRREGLAAVLPVIEPKRHNQAILIDGSRGSGKTALLITLIDTWNQAFRDHCAPKSGLSAVCDPKGRVFPLALMDLRSLPNDVSLLVQVTGHLRALVDKLGLAHHGGVLPIAPGDDTSSSDASRAWQVFLTAAASTEQHMRQRSANLDPESFAAELHDTEQDRLHVKERFAEVLDHILEAFTKHRAREPGIGRTSEEETPVFVIAIDDADMNPRRLGECFELLDTLEHPRLVFVMTGDSKLFRHSLRSQFLGELRQPLGQTQLGEADREALDDLGLATTLAERYYEKRIPLHHRCHILELSAQQRIALVEKSLEAIPLDSDANMAMVFMRSPELGNLLPGRLRELVDFGKELRDFASPQGAVMLLVRLKDGVTKSLTAEQLEEFRPDELIAPVKGVLSGGAPKYQFQTRSLVYKYWFHEHTVLQSDTGDTITIYTPGRFGARRRASLSSSPNDPLAPPLQSDEEPSPGEIGEGLLHESIALLAKLIEYTAPFLNQAGVKFGSVNDPLGIQTLTTSFPVGSQSRFESEWPEPSVPHPEWRDFEFVRLWEEAIEEVIGGSRIDDEIIELMALNYANIRIHLVTATLSTDPPAPLKIPEGAREAKWAELINHAVAEEQPIDLRVWVSLELVKFAHPESRLSAEAAGRLLRALSGVDSHRLGLEDNLLDSDASRWRLFERKSRSGKNSSTKLRIAFDRHFAKHPWTRRLASLVDATPFARLETALAQFPVASDESAAWLPPDASGYLVYDTRRMLSEGRGDILTEIARTIDSNVSYGPIRALYEAWLSSGPADHSRLERDDFTIRPLEFHGLARTRPIKPQPTSTTITGVEFLVYGWSSAQPSEHDCALGMYRLIFDFVGDRSRTSAHLDQRWSLFRTRNTNTGELLVPWPAVRWHTFIDREATAARWLRFVEPESLTADGLGVLARSYIQAQVRTFESRDVESDEETLMTWSELFERARARCEEAPPGHARTAAFRRWTFSLSLFAAPSAGLPVVEAAACFVAYLEIIHPLVDGVTSGRAWRLMVPDQLVYDTDGRRHPVTSLEFPKNPEDVRAIVRRLREGHRALDPDLFTIPCTREAAATELRAALSRIETTGAWARNNLDAYLSSDLVEVIDGTYSGTLERVTKALARAGRADDVLLAAWNTAGPHDPTDYRHDGLRNVLWGQYRVAQVKAESAKKLDTNRGMDCQFSAGETVNPIKEGLALVFHALAHDLQADAQPAEDVPAPISWPLAKVSFEPYHYECWPAVQWLARFDMDLQLGSWQLDFERRKEKEKESLTARMRNFIASTVHVFRTRTLYQRVAGSWEDVIRAAWKGAKIRKHQGSARCAAYTAWVAQIPRFALPRTGVDEHHAADILVRFVEVTGGDPRSELVGRLDQVSSSKMSLPFSIDNHPASLVANAETREELQAVLNTLRERYELG